ncbi:MAG: hypothetical protein MPJ50_03940 [Pirellulales bacterium]|nr:hypothetical protein [Pirellulales bacterium]
MPLSPDDPRVTAAALGELLPEEQATFDCELAEAAEPLRAEIEQAMRETASLATRIRSVRRAELEELEAKASGDETAKHEPATPGRISQAVLAKALGQSESGQGSSTNQDGPPAATISRGNHMNASKRGPGWLSTLAVAACMLIGAVIVLSLAAPEYSPLAMLGEQREAATKPAPASDAGGSAVSGDMTGADDSRSYRSAPMDSAAAGAFGSSNADTSTAHPDPTASPGDHTGGDLMPAFGGGSTVGDEGRPTGGGISAFEVLRHSLPPRLHEADGDRSGRGGDIGGGQMSNSTAGDGANQNVGGGHDQQSHAQRSAQPTTDDVRPHPPRAAVPTWKRSPLTPNASRLMIGDGQELPLEGMQANVQVDGYRARVLLDLYFMNDSGATREADFRLRLPPEASLYYFAFGETVYSSPQSLTQALGSEPAFFNIERSRQISLDPKRIIADRRRSWVEPKEARMVQREKAAFAYGQTVRRRVDPALVEWAGAGVFTARVFPVQPGKLHRIVVGYDVNLTEEQGDLVYRFAAPYAKQAMLDLRVTKMDGVNVSISPEVQAFSDDVQQHYRVENPNQIVELRMEETGNVLLVGGDADSGNYFSGRFTPQLPEVTKRETTRDAIFLLDTSLSANPDRFNVYLQLLETMLRENRDTMPRFAVLFFNAHSHWWQESFVENTDENIDAVMQYAQTLALEGATDLSNAAFEAVHPRWLLEIKSQPFDYFLLSDGAMTWGERDAQAVAATFESSEGALFAYTTNSAGDDLRTLTALTSTTGGAVFSIVAEDQVTKVATAHLGQPWELIDVSLTGGQDVMLAGNPQTVYPDVALQVVGRAPESAGNLLTVNLRRGTEEQSVKVPFEHVVLSDMASRHYGQVAVAGLEEFVSETEAIATAYARHFRITGRTCSLLMLESEEDYERFNIEPDDDAFVVASEAASPVIDAARTATADRRLNAKADFEAWLARLEKMPGLEFQVPQSLEVMLGSLPEGAFQVRPRPLQPRLITWDKLPTRFQDAELLAETLNYDEITSEAKRRLGEAGPDDALVALSSLIESSPGDFVLLRDVAYSALEFGRADQALPLFRQVAAARPYEPQTYHALARCAETLGNADLAMLYYEVSVRGQWDSRFGEFRQIAGLDYLRLLRQIDTGKVKSSAPEFAAARLNSVSSEYGLGVPELVITMAWNTDNTDVDLHVTDPTGEECYYSHPNTRIGGHLTTDVTQGFGPEMFVLRKAIPGAFQVKAHYYSTDANRTSTRTRVFLQVYQDWGTADEAVNSYSVLLNDGKEMHDVATVKIKE